MGTPSVRPSAWIGTKSHFARLRCTVQRRASWATAEEKDSEVSLEGAQKGAPKIRAIRAASVSN